MSCEVVHEITQNDTGVAFSDHLSVQGVSIDLTDAQVQALLVTQAGTVLVESNADVLQEGTDQDKTEPNVRYLFAADDLETVGLHNFQWRVTLPNGRVITRPPTPHKIKVIERLTD